MPAKGQVKDLTLRRFGRLIVIRLAAPINGRTAWMCLCDCGTMIRVHRSALVGKITRSCGCLWADLTGGKKRKIKRRAGTNSAGGPRPSKLSESDVGAIRKVWSKDRVSSQDLALRFGVEASTIRHVTTNRIRRSRAQKYRLQHVQSRRIETTDNLSRWTADHNMTYSALMKAGYENRPCKGWRRLS